MRPYIRSESRQYFAFNIWSISSAKAVMDGAVIAGQDIILQTSVKVFKMIDKEELRRFITSYTDKNKIQAYLHLDHCRDLDDIEEAIKYGWDSVMIDASQKPLEENIRLTNAVCETAGKYDVLVEAEIGQVPGAEDGIEQRKAGIARLDDIERFVRNGKMNTLAVAIGTSHGLYKGIPEIRYDLIEKVSEFTDIPLVIHGGTGLTDEMFLKLLSYKNVKKINISTDVKQAWRQGILDSTQKGYMEMDGFDPLKVEKQIHDSLQNMTVNKLKLLRNEVWQ